MHYLTRADYYLQVFIGSWLLHLIGRRLGGRADVESIQPIIAWSNVPFLLLLVLGWALLLVESVAEDTLVNILGSDQMWPLWLVCGVVVVIELGAIAWSLRILVLGLAAVHGYSTVRAIQTVLLAWFAAASTIVLLTVMLGLTPYMGRFFLGNLVGML